VKRHKSKQNQNGVLFNSAILRSNKIHIKLETHIRQIYNSRLE